MKTPKLYFAKALLLLLALTFFYACKKDKSQSHNITGKWVAQIPLSTTPVYQDIFQFNSDSTYTQSRVAVSADNQIIGYGYVAAGKFHLNGDQLQLYSILAKSSANYGPLNQMVTLTASPPPATYTVSIASNQREFHFVFQCGPNENCIPNLTYIKQ